jgi:sporulation protein YlmC with PRC-barrel domain
MALVLPPLAEDTNLISAQTEGWFMKIELGQKVNCLDKEVGKVSDVILDAESFDLHEFVVSTGLIGSERLVPLVLVDDINNDGVKLSINSAEFDELGHFEEREYKSVNELDAEMKLRAAERAGIDSAMWGAGYYIPFTPVSTGIPVTPPQVISEAAATRPGERSVSKGMSVISSDDHKIGRVLELTYDASDKRLQSFEVEHGLIFTSKQSIPADWIGDISSREIRLNRTEDQVKELNAL